MIEDGVEITITLECAAFERATAVFFDSRKSDREVLAQMD